MSARPAQHQPPGWHEARAVLCVRLDALGDVLMSGPALRALARAPRGRRLTLLTSAAGAAAAELMPEVAETIVYEAPWAKPAASAANGSAPGRPGASERAMIESLRARHFDAAVIMTVYSQSALPAALLCLLAGIPLRIAYSRERAYGLLTDPLPEREPGEQLKHEVERQLDLVAHVGCAPSARPADRRLRVRVSAGARTRVSSLLQQLALRRARPWVVAHPGGSAPSRRYPPELFARALDQVADESGAQALFSGDARDVPAVEAVRARMRAPSHSLAGCLSVGELAALLAAAPLLVAGNTGAVHLAAAVGTPVVQAYALTNPQHTAWQVPSVVLTHDVPCRWCYASRCPEQHHACLRQIAPAAVAHAVSELLGEPRRTADGAVTLAHG